MAEDDAGRVLRTLDAAVQHCTIAGDHRLASATLPVRYSIRFRPRAREVPARRSTQVVPLGQKLHHLRPVWPGKSETFADSLMKCRK